MALFKPGVFTRNNLQLGYNFYRGGEHLLILFPGYGQQAKLFIYFVPNLHSQFSLLAIDHLQHGDSRLSQENECLNKDSFIATLQELVAQLGFASQKIIVGGFSYGNWLAAESMSSDQINIAGWIIISAPSTRFSSLFKFSTTSFFGKACFKFMVQQSHLLKKMILGLESLHVLPADKARIVSSQIANEEKIQRLYINWNQMRHFIPNWSLCSKMAQNKQLRILFAGGLNDKVTPLQNLKPYFENYHRTQFLSFEAAHTFVHEEMLKGMNGFLEQIVND